MFVYPCWLNINQYAAQNLLSSLNCLTQTDPYYPVQSMMSVPIILVMLFSIRVIRNINMLLRDRNIFNLQKARTAKATITLFHLLQDRDPVGSRNCRVFSLLTTIERALIRSPCPVKRWGIWVFSWRCRVCLSLVLWTQWKGNLKGLLKTFLVLVIIFEHLLEQALCDLNILYFIFLQNVALKYVVARVLLGG